MGGGVDQAPFHPSLQHRYTPEVMGGEHLMFCGQPDPLGVRGETPNGPDTSLTPRGPKGLSGAQQPAMLCPSTLGSLGRTLQGSAFALLPAPETRSCSLQP